MPVRRVHADISSANTTIQVDTGAVDLQKTVDKSELEKLVRQIVCKRSLQDEDSQLGPAATVYDSQEVAKLVRLICGERKSKLKATGEILNDIKLVVKHIIKDTKLDGGILVKEGLTELFHNEETIVFQNLFENGPEDWVRLVLPLIGNVLKKEVLRTELDKEVSEVNLQRRGIAKDYGLEKKQLSKLLDAKKYLEEKGSQHNVQRLQYAIKAKKDEIQKTEESRSKSGPKISNAEVKDLLEKFEALKSRQREAKSELSNLSCDGTVPPSISEAREVVDNRKQYLASLLARIETS